MINLFLLLFTLLLSPITKAEDYYHLDPTHLHGEVISLNNMEEVFNKGRMQVYKIKTVPIITRRTKQIPKTNQKG